MPKILAEVALGGLQTIDRSVVGAGEIKERIVAEGLHSINLFDLLNLRISRWICGMEPLKWMEYRWLYLQCLEKVRCFPHTVIDGKGTLTLILSELPQDYILNHPSDARKYILRQNRKLEVGFLITPRGLGSEKWRMYHEKIRIVHIRYNGPRKHQFPQKSVIGVGYRDKGNCRKEWIDGSPHWKEVCVTHQADAKDIISLMLKNDFYSRKRHTLQYILSDSWLKLKGMPLRSLEKSRRREFSLLF